jgi:hypothetical protein
MRNRLLLPVALLALLSPVAVACSDGGEIAARSSGERAAADTGSEDSGSGSGEPDGGTGEPGGGSEDPLELPDIPDLPDDLGDITDGLGEIGDCLEIAALYGSLYFEAIGGADGAAEAERKAEELKEVLPADLADEIDVIAEAIGRVATEGITSDALGTPEYEAADEAIADYLTSACEGGGGGQGGDGA